MLELIVLTIVIALIFDFINGFHDSANAISTIVATKVLTPAQAVAMAAVGNLVGPLFFGTAVAATIGKGIIDTKALQGLLPPETFVVLVLSALLGAIFWDLLTWYFGIPVSSSHALVGGLIGAAIAAAGPAFVLQEGVSKILLFTVISPVAGFVVAFAFGLAVMRIARNQSPEKVNRHFRKLQLLSAFFYAVTHGTNDAQKTMGIVTVLLVAGGFLQTFSVPLWVILAAHVAISLGTLLGGWRIVRTMAHRITPLKPYQGFCAETAGGLVLANTAGLGIPVSTTHAIAGSIMGVGATVNPKNVRWGVSRSIVAAWIITLPVAALAGGLAYVVFHALIA